MTKSFSTLSETRASLTAEQSKKRNSRQPSNPAAKRRNLSLSTSSQLSDSDENIRELLTDINSDESNVVKPPSSQTREDKFLDELAHEFEQQEETTSPIAAKLADIINKRWAANFSDSKLYDRIEKYERPELTKKYGQDFPAKEGAVIYTLPRYRKSSLKLAQFWHNVLIS